MSHFTVLYSKTKKNLSVSFTVKLVEQLAQAQSEKMIVAFLSRRLV